MTVLIYLDTSTQVGGPDHPRSLRVPMPQKLGSRLVGNHWISGTRRPPAEESKGWRNQ